MAFAISPVIGADVTNTILATDIASGARTVPFAIGTETWGSDGKRYVFAKASASISASATCTVNASTFLAATGAGGYTSPATAMVTGDYGWFSAASV